MRSGFSTNLATQLSTEEVAQATSTNQASHAHDGGPDDLLRLAIVQRPAAQAAPVVTWTPPQAITYGEALSAAQLNATAWVPGTLVYTPALGFVLPAGTHTIWVTFTPADSAGGNPVQLGVSMKVGKASPAVIWPEPAGITSDFALNESQLNATALVPGRFEYSPAAGTRLPAGTHTLNATFIPADLANYETAQASVSIDVALEKSPLEWLRPESITYGTLLSAKQLCAYSPLDGEFEYQPSAGAFLGAGEHPLSVLFKPADTQAYSPARTSVSLHVAKAVPPIEWSNPEPVSCGTQLGAAQLNASSTVPGWFTYTPAFGAMLDAGMRTLSVTFAPADAVNYSTARAEVLLTVRNTLPVQIEWATPAAVVYGVPLTDAQLNAIASVPGKFDYLPAAGHLLAPGKHTLTARFTPADCDRYKPTQATVLFEVETPSSLSSVLETNAALPDVASPHTAASNTPRETRVYKGAVYEKGEDHQWHLRQKN